MTQAEAMKAARASVGQIHAIGREHRFNVFDAEAGAWREGARYRTRAAAVRQRERAPSRALVAPRGVPRRGWAEDEGQDGTARQILARLAEQAGHEGEG